MAAIVNEFAEAKRLADPRHIVKDGVYALELVINAGWKDGKGRGGLVRMISGRIEEFCQRRGVPVLRDDRRVRLFSRHHADEYMSLEGKAICNTYIPTYKRNKHPSHPDRKMQLDLFHPGDDDKIN